MKTLAKPIYRSKLRQVLGKEYHIYRRYYNWLTSKNNFAKKSSHNLSEIVYQHRSMILRPLANVDMQLQENKRKNLKLAIPHLNGIVIQPGEVFSIWKNVGRPSRKKGYLEGLVLKQGQITSGTGGGLCQLGNLLFWIFAHSPLDIIERYRHGFDVFPDVNRKVPFGAGATLAYNHIDLQVKNNTEQPFAIELWLDETHLNGKLLTNNSLAATYKIEERNHIIQQQTWGGYSRHNQIYQLKYINDSPVDERLLVENHAIMMYSPLLEHSVSPFENNLL